MICQFCIDHDVEVALLEAEWASLTGLQRVLRVAMVELITPEEHHVAGIAITSRGLVLEAQEMAA